MIDDSLRWEGIVSRQMVHRVAACVVAVPMAYRQSTVSKRPAAHISALIGGHDSVQDSTCVRYRESEGSPT